MGRIRKEKGKNPDGFLKVFEKNLGMITTSCIKYGISRSTYYKWIENIEGFKERVDDVLESLMDMGECALYKKIQEGDTKAIIFYNETKNKNRGYVKTNEQKITLDDSTIELEIK